MSVDVAPIPEPTCFAMLATGLLTLRLLRHTGYVPKRRACVEPGAVATRSWVCTELLE